MVIHLTRDTDKNQLTGYIKCLYSVTSKIHIGGYVPDSFSAIAERAAKTVQILAVDGRVDPKALPALAGVFFPEVVVGFGQRVDGKAINGPPGDGG
jgi:hypothetical protein